MTEVVYERVVTVDEKHSHGAEVHARRGWVKRRQPFVGLSGAMLAVMVMQGEPMVTVTPEAADAIRDVLHKNGWPTHGLRFGLRDGGCSGYSYMLDFEEAPDEDDLIHEQHGVRVFIHPLHVPFVQGSTISWKSDLWESGFRVENPNATRLCGCGESFAVS